jgi:hypothetical protein
LQLGYCSDVAFDRSMYIHQLLIMFSFYKYTSAPTHEDKEVEEDVEEGEEGDDDWDTTAQ